MLKRLSNKDLTLKLRALVHEERKITLQILELICESERRRLFAESGYSSLFDWLTRELGYSEGAAQRRIESARLLRAVPSVAEKIESGSLSLTNLAKVGSTLRRVKSQKVHGTVAGTVGTESMTESMTQSASETKSQKPESFSEKAMTLIGLVEGKSSRQADVLLSEKFPELPKPDFVRKVDHETLRAQVTLTNAQHEKLERVREIASHHGASLAELIEIATDEFLKRRDPLVREVKARRAKTSRAIPEAPHPKPDSRDAKFESRDVKPESPAAKSESQAAKSESQTAKSKLREDSTAGAGGDPQTESARIDSVRVESVRIDSVQGATLENSLKHSSRQKPSLRKVLAPSVRNLVYRRAQGTCEFRDSRTGNRCTARVNLEIDHIQPLALGGTDDSQNLRALCRSHNQLEATHRLGFGKMNIYRKESLR